MNDSDIKSTSVLITGAGGYIGRLLVEALAGDQPGLKAVVAADVREISADKRWRKLYHGRYPVT
jgi:uncharacterized protein YbjT (DUF2867 family)